MRNNNRDKHFMSGEPCQTESYDRHLRICSNLYLVQSRSVHDDDTLMINSLHTTRSFTGYTGFVPRARNLLGATYPVITHMALNEFSDTERRQKAQSAEPVTVHRKEPCVINTKPIYPINSGLVPHYTGHIPGKRYAASSYR